MLLVSIVIVTILLIPNTTKKRLYNEIMLTGLKLDEVKLDLEEVMSRNPEKPTREKQYISNNEPPIPETALKNANEDAKKEESPVVRKETETSLKNANEDAKKEESHVERKENEEPQHSIIHINGSRIEKKPAPPGMLEKMMPKQSAQDVANRHFNDLPLHDMVYKNESRLNSDRAVFVVPRIAYYDRRLVRNKPRNKVLIIAEIHYKALNTIKACELNGHVSESVSVLKDDDEKRSGDFTHCYVIVECEGFAKDLITEDSTTKLIYKKEGDRFYSRVTTEKPLLLTNDGSHPTQGSTSIVVCSTLSGHPELFKEWLKYQDTIGVDFVHFNADKSFYENPTTLINPPYLQESINDHFAQVEVWNDIVGKRIRNAGKDWKYKDCILRYAGIFGHGMLAAVDEFFTPLDPTSMNVNRYLNKQFSRVNVASVKFDTRQMQCGPIPELRKNLMNGNVTSILSGYASIQGLKKITAHRLNSFLMTNFPGFTSATVSTKYAYFAQNRVTKKPC